jgi:hypothetical protein
VKAALLPQTPVVSLQGLQAPPWRLMSSVRERVIVSLDFYPAPPHDYVPQVEIAVGVLMELRRWDATAARGRLLLAASNANTSTVSLARAILSFYP